VIFQNEPIFSWFSDSDVYRGRVVPLFKTVSLEQADEDRAEFAE